MKCNPKIIKNLKATSRSQELGLVDSEIKMTKKGLN